MKTVYLVKKDVSIDAEDNWIMMDYQQFWSFLISSKGEKRKRYFRRIENCDRKDQRIVIEVDAETARQMDIERDRVKQIRKRRVNSGYVIVSFNAIQDEEYELNGEEAIIDEECDVETDALLNLEIEQLRLAIASLLEDERQFIQQMFLSGNEYSEREFAEILGVSPSSAHWRKTVIFNKVRSYMKNNNIGNKVSSDGKDNE